jgi:acyl carrier protein
MANETEIFDQLKSIAQSVLQLDVSRIVNIDTPLLGHVAELDSMAVVAILTSIEDHYGMVIEDDEISADVFGSWRALVDFVLQKLEQ